MELATASPKLTIVRHFQIEDDVETDIGDGEIPEDLMAFAEQVRGNGQARVSVTTPMDIKIYGNGSGASVTVTLECNQDDETIAGVIRHLGQWTRFFAKEQCLIADEEFRQMYAQRYPGKQL